MFQIDFTPDALEDLQLFRAYEQRQIIQSIETQLPYQPNQPTRNRKQLRPNAFQTVGKVVRSRSKWRLFSRHRSIRFRILSSQPR